MEPITTTPPAKSRRDFPTELGHGDHTKGSIPKHTTSYQQPDSNQKSLLTSPQNTMSTNLNQGRDVWAETAQAHGDITSAWYDIGAYEAVRRDGFTEVLASVRARVMLPAFDSATTALYEDQFAAFEHSVRDALGHLGGGEGRTSTCPTEMLLTTAVDHSIS